MSRTYSALAQNKNHRISSFWKSEISSGKMSPPITMLLFTTCSVILSNSHSQFMAAKTASRDGTRYAWGVSIANGKAGRLFLQPSGKCHYPLYRIFRIQILRTDGENPCPSHSKGGPDALADNSALGLIFVSIGLSDFLIGHKDTLEELILRDCYASTGARSKIDNGIYSSKLFNSLLSACPAQILRF